MGSQDAALAVDAAHNAFQVCLPQNHYVALLESAVLTVSLRTLQFSTILRTLTNTKLCVPLIVLSVHKLAIVK